LNGFKSGRYWNTLEDIGTLWKRSEHFGRDQNTLEDIGTLWKTLEHFGRHCHTLEDIGRYWNTLEDIGTLWKKSKTKRRQFEKKMMIRILSHLFRPKAMLARGVTTIAVQDRETPSEIADVIHVHLNSGSQSPDLSDMSR